MISAHFKQFCAIKERKRIIFMIQDQKHSISAHFCGFCAVFAIGFCLGFNIGVMVETVFCFYEIYRFLVLAFCFVRSWIFEVV